VAGTGARIRRWLAWVQVMGSRPAAEMARVLGMSSSNPEGAGCCSRRRCVIRRRRLPIVTGDRQRRSEQLPAPMDTQIIARVSALRSLPANVRPPAFRQLQRSIALHLSRSDSGDLVLQNDG
jgi:hypothetical protein